MRLTALQTAYRLAADGDLKHLVYKLRMRWLGIDLKIVELDELGLSPDHAKPYMNSGGPLLESALKTLPIAKTDAVLDYGAGKGGAMLTLAQFPFSRVDGVELSEDMVKVGKENLKQAKFRKGEIFLGDATTFTDLDPYTFFYLANPFPDCVLSRVMENISASQQRRPRTLIMVYLIPTGDAVVRAAGFQEIGKVLDDPDRPIFIYRKNP